MSKKFDKSMKTLLDGIVSHTREEDKASPVFAHLSRQIEYLKDPEDFHVMGIYPIERIAGTFVETQFKKDNYLARDIYLSYNFFAKNIASLCTSFYGFGCSVDKARFLLRAAINWKETGHLPVFNMDSEFSFHFPDTGTPKQWMDFIVGLQRLSYGYNQEYLFALMTLIKEHKKAQKKRKKQKN